MQEIENIIKKSMKELYSKDKILFNDNVSERWLVYNFAKYFEKNLKKTQYENLNIDIEYNRSLKGLKSIGEQRTSYPDLILHQRESNDNNIVVIEFKKWNNKNKKTIERDRNKLRLFKSEFAYKIALLIIFEKKEPKYDRIEGG